MIIIKHTIKTNVSREDVWNIWHDVKNWNTWDYSTEYSDIDGAFKEGTTGRWRSKEGHVLPMILLKVEPLKIYVTEFKLFLARIVASHYLTESAGKTIVSEKIEIKGPLAFLYAFHVGRSIKKSLPQEMEAMIKRAESLNKK